MTAYDGRVDQSGHCRSNHDDHIYHDDYNDNNHNNRNVSFCLVGTQSSHQFLLSGYTRISRLGSWDWTDGTTYGPYENWDTGNGYPAASPTFNCMLIGATGSAVVGGWYNTGCDDTYDILCRIVAT